MLKKLTFFLFTTLLASILSLELITNIVYFILVVLLSGFTIAVLFKLLKYHISNNTIRKLSFLSLFSSYLLFTYVATLERDIAFDKISSIPKENLKNFYESKDISIIPKEARYTWIGCWYRQIDVIDENKFKNKHTKAIGWKHNNVAAYYKITDDKFTGSYH